MWNIVPYLRNTPFITERLLMGCKESNQTKQNKALEAKNITSV